MAKPKLIVFDLDYTLWPFWVDTHVSPPIRMQSVPGRGNMIIDRHGTHIKSFPEVPAMLNRLKREGYTMAIASRTGCIQEAQTLVHLFQWDHFFTFKEIYPGRKTAHFNRFQANSGLDYREMLFFDDEPRNIQDISKLGVTAVHAPNGMSMALLNEGLEKFRASH